MAILLACVTFISTGLGGLAAIRFRDQLHPLLGFSAGAVLAVVFFDILPEVFSARGTPTYVMLAAAAGFLAFFALERANQEPSGFGRLKRTPQVPALPSCDRAAFSDN